MIILRHKLFSSESNKEDDDKTKKKKKKRRKIFWTSMGALGGASAGSVIGGHTIDNPYCRKCERDAYERYADNNTKGHIIGGILGAVGVGSLLNKLAD